LAMSAESEDSSSQGLHEDVAQAPSPQSGVAVPLTEFASFSPTSGSKMAIINGVIQTKKTDYAFVRKGKAQTKKELNRSKPLSEAAFSKKLNSK
jgi:hypothetical protein